MFSKVRNGLVMLAIVGGLFGATQASGIRIPAPTEAMARALTPCNPDLSSVSNERLSLQNIRGSNYIVSTVYVSTWCLGDYVNWEFHNESNGANYPAQQQVFVNNQDIGSTHPYATPGVYWDVYACGPLNCTSNLRIQTN